MPAFRSLLLAVILLVAMSTMTLASESDSRQPTNPSTQPSGANSPVPDVISVPPTQPPGAGSPAGVPIPGPQDTLEENLVGNYHSNISPPHDPATWTRLSFTVASCIMPPKIDGKLDDVCWKTATHATGFFRYGGGTPSHDQTEAWICADKTHLYFAFHCQDSHPNLIQESMTQRNGNLGNDDFVGIDIDSQGSRHAYSTFLITARGTQLEELEGGTADNVTWAGDWTDATQRVKDGWTCEMSIPFALMRYPRGTHTFGMVLYRKMSRETFLQGWPYMPLAGTNNSTEPQYLDEFTDIAPPFYTPRPIFLPYILVTAGEKNAVREGVDIKYPLSTTLTGVATLFPDFQTIEQDVTTINFSYNEKLLTDRRPFFAEGNDFLPYQDLFYSRRIGAVDGGLKIVGKQGDTTIGILTTGTRGVDAQTSTVINLQQDLGLYSHVLLDMVDDIQTGLPSNQAGKIEGFYGWEVGQTRYGFQVDHLPSWEGGHSRGAKDSYQIGNKSLNGQLKFTASYEDTAPDFVSNLGFNPELDRKGESLHLSQYNQFDKGWLENYAAGCNVSAYQHHTGGFFHNDFGTFANINTRSGYYFELDTDLSRRDQVQDITDEAMSDQIDHFHDQTITPTFGWNQKTLYQQGTVSDALGRIAGQSYNYLTLSQSILVSHPFSVQLDFSRLTQGTTHSTQTVATGNYRLNADRTIGARIVNQSGVDQGNGLGTNIYFSFSQQVRTGTDIFLLFGDPNAPKTSGKFTLKLVHPF